MAGFLFVLNREEAVDECMEKGEYSTYISIPTKEMWGDAPCKVLGDFATMREGDNVYFFSKRKIYGIGTIAGIENSTMAFNQAFENSIIPKPEKTYKKLGLVTQDISGNNRIQPWKVYFRPNPFYFEEGIDMDEMLASNPDAFRSLRCIQDLSFIKMTEQENDAFKSLFLRKNEALINEPSDRLQIDPKNKWRVAENWSATQIPCSFHIDTTSFVKTHRSPKNKKKFAKESALETSLLFDLANPESKARQHLGTWDYISHQVHASPFKPIAYMDKIDLFGYRCIKNHPTIVSKYLVAEIKKDTAGASEVAQLMRYVDWICSEYTNNDYSMIQAYLIASDFNKNALRELDKSTRYSMRPKKQKKLVWETIEWHSIELIKYTVQDDGVVDYATVMAPTMQTSVK